MKTLYTLLFALLVAPAFAQNAKVIALAPDDAKQAKGLYDEQQALTKRQNDFNEAIRTKYLLVVDGPIAANGIPWCDTKGNCPINLVPRLGWSYGFELSEDFKFIVPKPTPPPVPCSSNWGNAILSNCATFTTVQPVGYTTDLVYRGNQ